MMTASRLKPQFSSAPTYVLGLFLLLNAGIVSGIFWYASPIDTRDSSLRHTRDLFYARSGDDSWGPMAAALDQFELAPRTPLYTELVFNQGVKFQYPPSALFFLKAMRLAGADRVRTSDAMVFEHAVPINDVVGWIFLAVTILAVSALLELRLRHHNRLPARFDWQVLARALIVAGLTLTFYPVVKAFTLGQIQVWINALFAVTLLCWAMRHKILAGLVLGLICLIKPHFGLFLPWAFLRGEWRFAVACLGVVSAGLAASIAEFGWANHIDYLRLLSFISERGEAYYPNQSINGLLNRLMSLREPELYKNMAFVAGSFPPFNPWVYWGTLISSVAVLFAAILRIGGKRDRVIDFCILAVSITIAAPIAWEHHYGIFLPVFAVVFAGPPRSRRWLILIIASYVLISNYFPVANLLAETVLNPVQSYVLAGGLVLLVLLHFGAGEPVSGEQALSGSSTS